MIMQKMKLQFDEFLKSVHCTIAILGGIMFALNSKHHFLPFYYNVTYNMIFIQLIHFVYKTVFYKINFQELDNFLKSNPENDIINQYAGKNASGMVDKFFKLIGAVTFLRQIIQDTITFVVCMLITTIFIQ